MEGQSRKPSSRTVKHEELYQDLLVFQKKALELGASDAKIIPASYVVVQERVLMKCLVPRCTEAGHSPYCPPYTPQPDFMRKVFSQYQWAVLLKRDIESLKDYVPLSKNQQKEVWSSTVGQGSLHRKTWEIIGELESYIQSKGYDLAMGFSAGDCKHDLCASATCTVMQNASCRHPLQARPSMEGVGIDVFDIVTKVGWNAYMIRHIEPNLSEIPNAMSVGIVFVF